MNFNEYLLTCLGEEANEVAHRVSKALRFSLSEKHHSNPMSSNADLIAEELTDLLAVAEMAQRHGLIPSFGGAKEKLRKVEKVYRYANYSAQIGVLKHDLYKDGDDNIPQVICDRNGQVVLALCKVCGEGEGEGDLKASSCLGREPFDIDKC